MFARSILNGFFRFGSISLASGLAFLDFTVFGLGLGIAHLLILARRSRSRLSGWAIGGIQRIIRRASRSRSSAILLDYRLI